jgi:hypothetical protein
VELTDTAAGRHLSLQFDGDRLIGCNAIGWTQHVGAMRGLVEGQVRLGEWKDKLLRDPTLLMEAYLACAHRPAGMPLRAEQQYAIRCSSPSSSTPASPTTCRSTGATAMPCRWTCRPAPRWLRSWPGSRCRMKLVHLVLINGVYVPPEERGTRMLAEGDTLAIWPPIAGG